jgi:beta-galactosidase GanA
MKAKSSYYLAFIVLCTCMLPAQEAGIPHLRKQGTATQLIVDGKPFLVLGGELANTASSDLEYMNTVWPRLTRMNLNTVLTAVAWAWIEPEEGKSDFSLVDRLLDEPVGTISASFSCGSAAGKTGFVPAWVKSDQRRFPRVQIKGGKSIEVLSPFSDANRDADERALNYKLAEAAAMNQSGSGLRFSGSGPAIQRVGLYDR